MKNFGSSIFASFLAFMILCTWVSLALLSSTSVRAQTNSRLVYSVLPAGGTKDIYTINPDGSDRVRLTNDPAGEEGAIWSPDGSKIAFKSNKDGDYEIYVMSASGGPWTQLTSNEQVHDRAPSWNPEGTQIVFASDNGGNFDIYKMNADGSNVTQLTTSSAREITPAWSPDGTKIAYTSNQTGNQDIYTMNVDGTGKINLTQNPADDQISIWSPDNTKIAFKSNRGGDSEIFVMNTNGSNQINLTNNNFEDRGPAWSPDGAKIAFSTTRDGNSEIYIMNSNGSNLVRVTNTPEDEDDIDWGVTSTGPQASPSPSAPPRPSPSVTPSARPSVRPSPTVNPSTSPPPLTSFMTMISAYMLNAPNIELNGDDKINALDFVWLVLDPSPSPSSPTVTPSPSSTPRPSPSQSPRSSPQAKPNILFIVSDDQPLESLSHMPYLSTRNNWFKFNQAYANVSICCPSRATMLSGKYSHHTGVESNGVGNLLDTSKTVAVWLNNAGYRTGLIGKYLNYYPFGGANFIPPGWDHWIVFSPEEGIDKFYYNYSLNENGQIRNYGSAAADYSTDVLKRKALDFINSSSSDPFFLMWTPHTPHEPFTPAPRHENANVGQVTDPPNFNEADVSDKPQWIRNQSNKPAGQMRTAKLNQYRMLLAVDEAIEEFVEALQSSGKLNNTIIIYIGDNGLSLGSHKWDNKNCVYEECTHIPLLIYHPSFPGRTINNLVGNMDITATIVEMAGAQATSMDGISMMPLIRNSGNFARTSVLLRMRGDTNPTPGQILREYWGLRKDKWKYAEFVHTGEKELYDLNADPYELNNLAANADKQTLINQLHNEVNQLND